MAGPGPQRGVLWERVPAGLRRTGGLGAPVRGGRAGLPALGAGSLFPEPLQPAGDAAPRPLPTPSCPVLVRALPPQSRDAAPRALPGEGVPERLPRGSGARIPGAGPRAASAPPRPSWDICVLCRQTGRRAEQARPHRPGCPAQGPREATKTSHAGLRQVLQGGGGRARTRSEVWGRQESPPGPQGPGSAGSLGMAATQPSAWRPCLTLRPAPLGTAPSVLLWRQLESTLPRCCSLQPSEPLPSSPPSPRKQTHPTQLPCGQGVMLAARDNVTVYI